MAEDFVGALEQEWYKEDMRVLADQVGWHEAAAQKKQILLISRASQLIDTLSSKKHVMLLVLQPIIFVGYMLDTLAKTEGIELHEDDRLYLRSHTPVLEDTEGPGSNMEAVKLRSWEFVRMQEPW
ncbi:hypothetical protein SASPL_106043 [Salvia splendens]|uniref:Uncharacterized protein n=1 Tax=Salvia splendens TaxID=180675 RepID=A0A8X9ABC4_SALSN|nr:hypothetical protein SASPL_106043 [Salvia splendens]